MNDFTLREMKKICETHACHECPANDPDQVKPCLFLYSTPSDWPIGENEQSSGECHWVWITYITLLSIEEYEKYKDDISCVGTWWWLRSPGHDTYRAASVGNGGSVNRDGSLVDLSSIAVRPALKLGTTRGLNVGTVFELAGQKWTLIDDNLAICNRSVGQTYFRDDVEARDANDYEKSNIKMWLANWTLENGIKKETFMKVSLPGSNVPKQLEIPPMPTSVNNDQSAKADAGKLPLTLVPREIIRAIAAIRLYGTKKYKDPDNWKIVSKERYRDAAFRHFIAYLDDPDGMDEESGLPHLWHLATNISFLCELEKEAIDKNRE